jgi:hypothetical protein
MSITTAGGSPRRIADSTDTDSAAENFQITFVQVAVINLSLLFVRALRSFTRSFHVVAWSVRVVIFVLPRAIAMWGIDSQRGWS